MTTEQAIAALIGCITISVGVVYLCLRGASAALSRIFNCRARHADGTRCDRPKEHTGSHAAFCECCRANTKTWSET